MALKESYLLVGALFADGKSPVWFGRDRGARTASRTAARKRTICLSANAPKRSTPARTYGGILRRRSQRTRARRAAGSGRCPVPGAAWPHRHARRTDRVARKRASRVGAPRSNRQAIDDDPGVGVICAVVVEALAPPSESFSKGRDFAAWLGLTPYSPCSGDNNSQLGGINSLFRFLGNSLATP